MYKRYAVPFLITLFILAMAIPANCGLLDGKTFVGKSAEIGKQPSMDEELRFQNGKLYSVSCAEYGFGENDYTSESEGDRINFKSTLKSEGNGQIVWEGTVLGDTIEANFSWTKERWYWKDAHQEKWMKGTLKK